MSISYDTAADAAYIYFTRGTIAQSVKLADTLILDLDADGKSIGLEILGASAQGQFVDTLRSGSVSGIPITVT